MASDRRKHRYERINEGLSSWKYEASMAAEPTRRFRNVPAQLILRDKRLDNNREALVYDWLICLSISITEKSGIGLMFVPRNSTQACVRMRVYLCTHFFTYSIL